MLGEKAADGLEIALQVMDEDPALQEGTPEEFSWMKLVPELLPTRVTQAEPFQ
jgi:hypothetical protein